MKEYMHPYAHSSMIYNSQTIKATHVPINIQVDKKVVVHICNEILFRHKKEENFILCDSMDGPGEHNAKWNKSVRERQISYGFTSMWNLMNKQLIRKIETDSDREQNVSYVGDGFGGGGI